jgi:RHS repeat-associated protein
VWTGGVARADRPAPGAATPDRLKLPSGPSSVRGLADEPSIDPFAAQINYQVPIELPGGYGQLAPTLALTYSGALGNGPMGIGWTLSQPRIQRSTRLGVPKFDDTDQLEISGIVSGRLVAIGNGEYRVEAMGQTVRVKAAAAGGFDVDDGKGVHYRLGTSAASRQNSDATHTLAWLVEQQTNTMGEQITYGYTHDQNQIYLASISWGPGAVYGVTLDYQTRGDPTRSYRGGFGVVTAQRLATITVTANGTVRRAYHLSYDTTFPVARLSGVTSTGVGGDGSWPALSFTYAAPGAAQVTSIAGVGNWRLNSNGTTLVDLDGDGAADLLQLTNSGHSYLTNQNGTFGGLQTLSGNALPLDSLQLQDVDGDARPELLQDTGSGWSVWKFSKTRWVSQPGLWPGSSGLALKHPDTTRFADLNGDGISDAIQWNNDGLQIHFATPTGLLPSRSVDRIGGTALPTATGRFQDINGDGLDDYVVIAIDHLEENLGHGDGTFDAMSRVAFPFPGTISNPQDIELADVDRDGLMDLIQIQTGTVLWFRGNPDGTFQPEALTLPNPEPLSSNVVVAVADTNGNGSQDIVWSSASGMWRMDLAGATTAGMLVEVTNGLGMDMTFSYQSSHALSAAARAAGTAWSSEVPIAMPVIVQTLAALGPGETTRQVSYAVRDGFWDATEQRFGGFLTTMVTTAGAAPAQTSTVNTTYSKGTGTNRDLRGKPLVVQVFDGTSKRLLIVSHTWTTMPVSGLPDTPLLRAPVLQRTVTQFDESPARNTDITYTFDTFGRTTHVVDRGRLDIAGDEAVKDLTYADDDTTWVRDQLCEEKVSALDGTVASDIQHLFGDDQTEQALCVVGKGWPRETRALLASEGRYITQSQTKYDAHGNPLSVTTGGVERRFVYDADGLFPIEEHLSAPSRELIWRASWNPVLATVTAITDPNGHTTHVRHDSLGRYTGVAIDGHLDHQVIEYDWTAPFPKTTTWRFDGALADVTAKPTEWSADSHWRQTVDVANGEGETRYHALRLSDMEWIVCDYREVDPNARVVFAGRPVVSSRLELSARPAGIVGDTLAYDPLGRVIEQDLPTGAKRTYSYVAFERTLQEVDLAPVHSVLDGQQRPILTERSLPDGTHEIVHASYDPAGRLIQMTLSGAISRSFTYDTLGRLIQTQDPDFGTRTLTWEDGNRIHSETNADGQTVTYSYDVLGRLSTRDTGAVYRYHYDDARPGADGTLSNLAGQLAWIEEPTGGFDLGYDELGRTVFSRRRIDARASEARATYSTSGLILSRSYEDGVSLTYTYNPAGHLVGIGDLWQLLDQDASGRSLHERTQNGVDTRYERDGLGLASRVTVRDGHGTAIYDAIATRNDWAGITSITDLDGVGLDHSARFSYDAFARLTSASAGSGPAGYSFGYGYDVLHNMTSRTAAGPHPGGAFVGTYHYGEGGHAPRQLTSITDAAGQVTHTFDYDAAGRQVAQGDLIMTYDATDRLMQVAGLSSGSVTHVFGQDGARVKTVGAGGSVSYFFGDGVADRNGLREHDVTVGDRVVARVTMSLGSGAVVARGGQVAATLGAVVASGVWGLGLAALCLPLLGASRPFRRRIAAAGLLAFLAGTSCTPRGMRAEQDTLSSATHVTYLHVGFAAGPALFTDSAGNLVEERRYEPFGEAIDARIETASGEVVGSPDMNARDINILNKRTDAATGWSDHGARWMVPETGRWLTPDPPVESPDAKFMLAPWALQPYGYVDQNPVIYWDPSGRSTFDANSATWKTDQGDSLDDVAKETGLRLADLEKLNPELANSSSAGGQVISLPRVPRIMAFEEAAKAIGATDYALAAKKGDFDVNTNKCNLFVNDIAEKTGAKFPKRKNFWGNESGPVTAGTLGDLNSKLSGLKIVADKDKAIGDVVAWKRTDFWDATGHTAIYAGQVGIVAKDGTVYRYPDGGAIGAGTTTINDRSMTYMTQHKYVNPVYRRIEK